MSINHYTNLEFATIRELQAQLAAKKISREELLKACLDRFAKYDEQLGTALEIFDESSILARGQNNPNSLLNNIPGLIKDNICQKDRNLTCASKILQGFKATYDATVTTNLKQAGALVVGRANMDEFAMGSSNEYSAYKKVANPWDMTRVSGGSSGGSIAAVAAGLVPWSLGSETGGSVRLPAAFCGIVGIKPTYGLVSRYGLVAYASSLDQVGVATRTVYDNALVLSQIAGHDAKDSTSAKRNKLDYTQNLTEPTLRSGLKIGIITNALNAEGVQPEISQALDQAIKHYEKLGAEIKPITLNTMDYSAAAYFIISRAEAASNLARFDGVRYGNRAQGIQNLNQLYAKTRGQGFGPDVRLRILVGNYVLSAGHAGDFYHNARKVQSLIRQELLACFKDVDVLLAPMHAAPAFKFGALDNSLEMDLLDYFTCFVNLAGVPAIALPCGFTKEQLPIGFQLIGPDFSEDLLYQTAHAYEQTNNWWNKQPAGF